MSDSIDEQLFDENLSRLLERREGPPQLAEDAAAEMLTQLKTRQAELFPPSPTAKEQPMDATTTHPARSSWNTTVAWLLALAAVIVFALFFSWPRPSTNGLRGGGSMPPNVPIAFDEVIRKTLDDGTILIAHRDSKHSIAGPRRLTLEQGDVYLIVAKSDKPFVVTTADGEVRATGTRFAVSRNTDASSGAAAQTVTAVAQGRVTLVSNRGDVQLGAGQQGVLRRDLRPTREPAPRISHLVSWAKEAMGQEELLVEQSEKPSGLVALDPWGQQARLTLRRYDVDVVIENGIARTTIDQTFFNHNPWNTEGTFYFPLPPDASVSRLAMYVGGKLNEGGMVERGRGQQIYNDILYQRRDPALLEMMEGNIFKMRIFPLEGRQEKRILLSYTQTLDELYGTLRYWFPMDHTNSVAGKLSINVRVKDGDGTYEARSSTHDMRQQADGNDLVLEYEAEKIKPDQDFLLHLTPGAPLAVSRVTTCEQDGYRYLLARFTPQLKGTVETAPRQWIVVNDVSASRSNIEAEAQRYILGRLIEEADDDDSVLVVDLNTQAIQVSEAFVSVRSTEARRLTDQRTEVQLGATNLAAGLQTVAKVIRKHAPPNPHILYLGDGTATDGKTQLARLVAMIPDRATFIGIGVGKKVDAQFLQAAADVTGGFFTTINPDEDIDWRVFDLVAALNTPRLTDINVALRDASGSTVDAVAYPDAHTLTAGEALAVVARCSGSLPASVDIEGKLGGQIARYRLKLDEARDDATYIPRFWAKRHIDELLKSGSEHNEEVVGLSKQYYVVTPLTSLIVLEDDKMYEEYQVERGRKDHWALYPAPPEIEVVKEPVDWSRWGWWGGGIGEDEKVQAAERPQTIKEIVDSVQFRINAPFYYWRPQSNGQGRFALYALMDSKADPTNLLTYWLLLAAGKEDVASNLRPSGGVAVEPPSDETNTPLPPTDVEMPMQLFLGFDKHLQSPMLGNVSGKRSIYRGYYYTPLEMALGGGGGRNFAAPALGGWAYLPFGGELPEEAGDLQLPMVMQLGPIARDQLIRMPMSNSRYRMAQQLPMAMLMSGGAVGGADGSSVIPRQLQLSFKKALGQRWTRIQRDIQTFNRQYGNWEYGSDWNALDLKRSAGARWYGGLEGLLSGDEEDEEAEITYEGYSSGGFSLVANQISPLHTWVDSEALNGKRMAVAWVGVYDRSLKTQPGTCSVLAADYLVERKAALQEKLLDAEGLQELTAIEQALAGAGQAATRLEESGPFWGWQGWSYRPQPWTFQPPTIQAHQGYNWSFDLTRYTPGLYTDSADLLNEVVSQYGGKPRGKVSEAARQRIDAARKAIRSIKVRAAADGGPELLVAAGDRFAMIRRTEMSLEEQLVCDGQQILHLYEELGLAARRPATALRLASLRGMVPHLIAPADWLARQFDIDVEDAVDDGFTLTLRPIGQSASDATQGKQPKQARPLYQLSVRVDAEGRIRRQELTAGDERLATLVFDYQDQQVTLRWLDADDEQQGSFTYDAEPVATDDDSFGTDVSEYVVFDMPLRKPSYYAQRLERLEEDDTGARINLKRHHALASIQQLHTRRWGGQNAEAQKSLNEARELMQQAGIKAKLGDLTLLGSAGVYNLATVLAQPADEGGLKRFADHPTSRYLALRSSGWQNSAKLRDEHPDGLIGHLAAYHAAATGKREAADFETIADRFPDSPLLLAAAYYASNWGQSPEGWFRLYDHPRLSAMAIMMSATNLKTPEHKQRLATAFERLYQKSAEAGYDLPVSPQIAAHVRSVDGGRIWKTIADDKLARAQKSGRTSRLLQFAEQAMGWGDAERADAALQPIRDELKRKPSLRGQFALAQCYWAGGRLQEALEQYDEILQALEDRSVATSPALLAAVARLSQQAGQTARAIELEERALAAEHPYLPEMINLQAFRQRYNWLWQQYQSQVQAAVAAKDEEATDNWLARAEVAWQRWYEVDRQNPTLMTQMATMQLAAGRDEAAWLYLSTVIDQRPKDANSYYAVGQWYHGRNELDETERWYHRAYGWDTANPRWLFERAQVLDQLDRKAEARAIYRQIVEGEWAQGLQGYVNQAKNALQ